MRLGGSQIRRGQGHRADWDLMDPLADRLGGKDRGGELSPQARLHLYQTYSTHNVRARRPHSNLSLEKKEEDGKREK